MQRSSKTVMHAVGQNLPLLVGIAVFALIAVPLFQMARDVLTNPYKDWDGKVAPQGSLVAIHAPCSTEPIKFVIISIDPAGNSAEIEIFYERRTLQKGSTITVDDCTFAAYAGNIEAWDKTKPDNPDKLQAHFRVPPGTVFGVLGGRAEHSLPPVLFFAIGVS